jgi:2-desacetyl-2-hydroxyethyl bacteriochlorophyllide A dehydrogenase
MLAGVFYGPEVGLKLEDVKIPKITPQQVLVKVKTCGICSGDVQRLSGEIKVRELPRTLGHEPAGTIAEVGSEVNGFNVGDEVFLFATGCGECYYCKIGKDNVCDKIADGFGLGRDGAYAEYVMAYPKELFKLPKGLPHEAGSVLTAPTGTAFHSIRLAQVAPGDTAVVFGTGCLGTQAIQLLKIVGARVIAVDVYEEKLAMACKLGADMAINAKEKDPVTEIKNFTDGRGADVAFDFAGLPSTILPAIDSVRRGGKIMDVGSIAQSVNLSMSPFSDRGLAMTKELSLMTVSHCSRADMTKLLEVVANHKLDFHTGTAFMPLEEIHKGFEMKKSGGYLRVVITP